MLMRGMNSNPLLYERKMDIFLKSVWQNISLILVECSIFGLKKQFGNWRYLYLLIIVELLKTENKHIRRNVFLINSNSSQPISRFISVTVDVLIYVPDTNHAARLWIFSILVASYAWCGSHRTHAYSSVGLTKQR